METGGGANDKWGPVVAMLAVDVALSAMNILVKKSLDLGMNCLVLITARQVVATAFMAPIAYFKERKCRPKLTWWISAQLFCSALLGALLTQYFFFVGLTYTSATFACAFLNLAPVLTFLIALLLRQERLSLKNMGGRLKLLATIVCLGGVLTLMFYRGPPLGRAKHASQLTTHDGANVDGRNFIDKAVIRRTMGSIWLFCGCFCWSAWFLLQAKIGKHYPAVYSSTTIMFLMASLQAATLTVATTYRRGPALWIAGISWKLHLTTVLYAGVVGSGLCFLVMSWCIKKRGPVFTVAFSPLIQVMVAIIDLVLTRQPPQLGSVLGSILVVLGLYLLLWGKGKDAGSCEVKPIQVNPVQELAQNNSMCPKAEEV